MANNPTHIFRMTDYRNIACFCSDGHMYAKNYRDQPQISISHQQINNRRGSGELSFPSSSTTPHDYVPFYFSPITAMYFAIRNGKVASFDEDGVSTGVTDINDVAFVVLDIEHIVSSQCEYKFTDKACFKVGYREFDDWAQSKDEINWGLFNEPPIVANISVIGYNGVCRYATSRDIRPEYLDRTDKRMAEFLVRDRVSMDDVRAIVVQSDRVKEHIEAYFSGSVIVKPEIYNV